MYAMVIYLGVFLLLLTLVVPLSLRTLNISRSSANTQYFPPYDPLALFNQALPTNHPTDAQSTAIIKTFTSKTFDRGLVFSTAMDVPPLYDVTDSPNIYTVTWPGHSVQFAAHGDVRVGGGQDYPLILLNRKHPQHGEFVELRLWEATINHATRRITGSYGGLFHYNNDGRELNKNAIRGSKKSLSLAFYGAGTGSDLSYLAGLITRADYEAGVIRHALRFAYNNCTASNRFRPPAQKTDQPKGCSASTDFARSDLMDMGMTLQLDKAVNCASRQVPGKAASSAETRLLRMVCKAMQDYGAVMLDGTGAGAYFYMEDNATAQWGSVIEERFGSASWLFRRNNVSGPEEGLPLDKLRVLAAPASLTSWPGGSVRPLTATANSGSGSPATPPSTGSSSSNSTPSPSTAQPKSATSQTTGTAPKQLVPVSQGRATPQGTVQGDFDGNGTPDEARDLNNDGFIDPASEIIKPDASTSSSNNPKQLSLLQKISGLLTAGLAITGGLFVATLVYFCVMHEPWMIRLRHAFRWPFGHTEPPRWP